MNMMCLVTSPDSFHLVLEHEKVSWLFSLNNALIVTFDNLIKIITTNLIEVKKKQPQNKNNSVMLFSFWPWTMKSLYIEPQLGSRVLLLSVDLEAVEEEGGDEAFTENWQEKKGSLSDLHGHFF